MKQMAKTRIMHSNGFDYYTLLTKNEIEEIKKCRQNFEYFTQYVKITDPIQSKPTSLHMYDKQKDFINIMNTNHYAIILKSRQTGMSTIAGLYALWIQLFYPRSYIGILSKTGNDATKFLNDEIKLPFGFLPLFLKDKVISNNKRSIFFNNGSIIMSSTSTPTAFRSFSLTYLIIDEAQFIPHIEETFSAIVGTLSKVFNVKDNTTKRPYGISIISTPNGVGNWFYNMWQGQLQKENMYTPLSFHWRETKIYDDEWYEKMKKQHNNNERLINQELEMVFLGSGDTFFNNRQLQKLKSKPYTIEQISIEDNGYIHNEELYVWEKQQPNKQYIMGVDVQSKLGDDRSTIEIIDPTTFNQVQEYLGPRINFKDLQSLIYYIQTKLYKCLIQVEKNNNGVQVIEHLLDKNPQVSLYYDKADETIMNSSVIEPNRKYGFNTTVKTRPQILNFLYELLEDNTDFIRSERLIGELTAFEYDSHNKPQQAFGNHDDLVMAFAIQEYVGKQQQRIQFMNPDERLNLLSQFINSNNNNFEWGMK